MTPGELIAIWRDLGEDAPSAAGIQRVRLDADAAADIFACIYWPSRRPGLLIEGGGAYRPAGDRIPICRGVRTSHGIREGPEPRTTLQVMLEDDRLIDIFAVLAADLVDMVTAQDSAASALRRCIDRLCMWQGLFDRVPAQGLSEERQRGLFGELLVLESLFLRQLDPFASVVAWVGPDPAHQDFIHGGVAVEVKTSLAKRHARIVIANEKQLDEHPHEALVLAHLRLDESASLGESLPVIVARLRHTLAADPAVLRQFDDRVMLAGYLDGHASLYVDNRWRVSASRFYRVEGAFPRLTEATLPPGVGDIHYSIIADDLGLFEISPEETAALLGSDHARG